tara:strand:- start:7320 stop:8084 length:765 start_codon:yes stop_codon:yes gene_type:complete
MTRRKDFRAATTYTGQKIKGIVEISYKIDGVRILDREQGLVTRNDKKPPGLLFALTDNARFKIRLYGDCEVYAGSFVKSNSPMQQHDPELNCLTEDMVYPLDFEEFNGTKHNIDPRLRVATVTDPSPELIAKYLADALALDYEGLVLRTDERWYRVKPKHTADVFITGNFEQLDKNKVPKGQLGGFDTAYGKVTAFTDEMRQQLWDNPDQYTGRLMEVQYKELFDSGSFRYAVTFLRFRDDKDTESFDTKGQMK